MTQNDEKKDEINSFMLIGSHDLAWNIRILKFEIQ